MHPKCSSYFFYYSIQVGREIREIYVGRIILKCSIYLYKCRNRLGCTRDVCVSYEKKLCIRTVCIYNIKHICVYMCVKFICSHVSAKNINGTFYIFFVPHKSAYFFLSNFRENRTVEFFYLQCCQRTCCHWRIFLSLTPGCLLKNPCLEKVTVLKKKTKYVHFFEKIQNSIHLLLKHVWITKRTKTRGRPLSTLGKSSRRKFLQKTAVYCVL